MERKLTFDDAPAAAEALAEISADHEQGAEAVLKATGLDGLSNAELEAGRLAEAIHRGRPH